MILPVFPVSYGDFMLARSLADRISKLGGMQDHEALVISSWRVKLDAPEIVAILTKAFKKVEMIVPEFEEEGWPAGPNSMFLAVADHLEATGNPYPWFFMEADLFPLRASWLAELEQGYEEAVKAGKPYYGVINDSRFINLETKERFVLGRHMVGAGVYPPDFMTRCKTIEAIDPLISWDTHIGPEILPDASDTKLISHRWGTKNYHMKDGKLCMEAVDPVNFHDYSAPVDSRACIVHGAKDFSLYKLALSGDLVLS
jgi:hypothetical protein